MKHITWFITSPKKSFYTHEEVIFKLQDIVRDNFFESKVDYFYVKKDSGQEWWIVASVEEKNKDSILDFMEKRLATKKIKIKNDEPIISGETHIVERYSPDLSDDQDFKKYLHDNTLICFDLHQKDLESTNNITLFSRYMISFSTQLKNKNFLHEFFNKNSKHYQKIISNQRENKFWKSFNKNYPIFTRWNHFYYNLIWGVDLINISQPITYSNSTIFNYIRGGISTLNKAGVNVNIRDKKIKDTITKYF